MALSIFDQKTVRDSWKRKLSWRERDLTDTREAGFTKSGIFLPVCREFEKPSRLKYTQFVNRQQKSLFVNSGTGLTRYESQEDKP